jgi:hypothetical protein
MKEQATFSTVSSIRVSGKYELFNVFASYFTRSNIYEVQILYFYPAQQFKH